ncbi:hypothetical protein [Flavobacterium sinopsychrotolerans]|jgi:hypothetical protein|uniref:DUF3300 domain-containing protein n=1 Tax=Flavobacterium sinopsychrotolerans TaxID=604089 RepID=A0A1H8PI04_9FLAO|nr:hypothetical protein [Flavobacterium sinopsychrotolerans]SEO41639.1 hypothetical protein SAMN04487942_2707 [Flavobacterium sinopsychrotolerans]
MKTKLLLLSLLTSVFATQTQAQDRTSVNAMNAEISDNLDLRAVASIFGESRDLQDFERRLNDPELQISNLDLNNDNEVDYLRVIETVENRTHLIIVQSVIDDDVYQDVATIDVEKDRNNKIHVQVVGDVFMYGENYIYEPVYYSTPVIYASFWSPNYRPYYSTWNWGYYPSYYYAWNPFPVFRYRNNINISLNINNNYNYVTNRRSNRAVVLHNSRRSNGYERQNPNYSFSRRNANVTNRYELDQRRGSRNETGYSNRRAVTSREAGPQRAGSSRDYSQNRTNSSNQATPQRGNSQREYSQNRTNPSSQEAPQRGNSQREYSQNRTNPSSQATPQRGNSQRDYSQNRTSPSTQATPQRGNSQRDYSQNRTNPSSQATPQRGNTQRDYAQNRTNPSSQATPQRGNSQRDYSQNRTTPSRQAAPQRAESQSRGNSSRESAPQRTESQRGNSSRNDNRRS